MISAFENRENMYKIDRPMQVEEIERGLILPRLETQAEFPRWGLGGVCDESNDFVPLSSYDGGWATHGGKYDWSEEEESEDEVVYFGLYFNHWGHFLVDLLGRLWYYACHRDAVKKYKLAYIGEESPKGNYLEFFELLGITAEDMVHVTKPTRFKKVIVPEFACRSCVWYSEEYRRIFDVMIEKVEREGYAPDNLPDLTRVYFSRQSFGKAQASEVGEDNLVKWSQANDFSVLPPEKLSLRGQIYVWNHAKEIVCLNGSIPINVAFCGNEKLRLTVLHKTHLPHLNLDLFLLMRPCEVTLLDAYIEPFEGYPTSIGAGPFLLHPTSDVKEYSARRDFLFPFTEKELKKIYRKNRKKLKGIIRNFKGKLRAFLSRLAPKGLKRGIRKVLRRG